MADVFLATMLLLGGFGWAALVVLAMANHPTGGTDFAKFPFLIGVAAMVVGAVWWLAIIVGWFL